jgi:hypothetical protein
MKYREKALDFLEKLRMEREQTEQQSHPKRKENTLAELRERGIKMQGEGIPWTN